MLWLPKGCKLSPILITMHNSCHVYFVFDFVIVISISGLITFCLIHLFILSLFKAIFVSVKVMCNLLVLCTQLSLPHLLTSMLILAKDSLAPGKVC